MDAITLLRQDHRTVEKLFKSYEKTGDKAHKTRRDLVDQMIEELSTHASIEEQVFYPRVRQDVPDAEGTVLEGLEEHHIVKWTLSELEGLEPTDERFHPKVTVLMESVRHHVEEEESEMFPEVRKAMGRKALQELGDRLETAKKGAPIRPHPNAPDEPPGNVVAGVVSGAADRVRKAGEEAVKQARKRI